VGYRDIAERANRLVRRDPFAQGVGMAGRKLDHAGRLVDCRRLHNGQFVLAGGLADDLKAARVRGITQAAPYPPRSAGIFAVRDFSGLSSSRWALANAPASAAILLLARCIGDRL
jgi:hypothetical protein